jgi:DNA-directed RNA polymerase specialized sigma24 family protein
MAIDRPECGVDAAEQAPHAARIRTAMAAALAGLTADEQRLLRLRFRDNLPIVRIAAIVGCDATPLYRRLAALLRRVRVSLAEQGLTASDVRPLVGHARVDLEAALLESDRFGERPSVAG